MGTLPDARVREVESLVHDWLQEGDVPGASVVVFDADGERYAGGFGARDLETNAPATPDTLYGMGSIAKPVTALAVVDMADRGRLSLSDPVEEYVDHFADAPGEPITLAELLSHTSGMPGDGTGLLDQALDGLPAGVADERDRELWVRAATERRVTDGDRFLYYNTGYDVLGRVVEAVDGRDYAEYVREELFDPLGMDRSTFHREDFEADDDAMTGYRGGETAPEPAPFPFEELIHPSGGLVSSVRELSRFGRAAMTDGTLDGNRVASAATVERCQRGRATWRTYLDGTDVEYGYGWERRPLVGDELVGHGGSIVVSTAYLGVLENEGLGVAVACNTTARPHPGDLGAAVLAVAVGEPPTAVPWYALDAKREAVTGTYESFRGEVTATVEPDEGGIEVTISGPFDEFALTAFPASLDPEEFTFYAATPAGVRQEFEFDPGADPPELFHGRFRFERR